MGSFPDFCMVFFLCFMAIFLCVCDEIETYENYDPRSGPVLW